MMKVDGCQENSLNAKIVVISLFKFSLNFNQYFRLHRKCNNLLEEEREDSQLSTMPSAKPGPTLILTRLTLIIREGGKGGIY